MDVASYGMENPRLKSEFGYISCKSLLHQSKAISGRQHLSVGSATIVSDIF